MQREASGDVLQTTAQVNGAYLRLIDANFVEWQNRLHLFAISANLMLRTLVVFPRCRRYRKRRAKFVNTNVGFDRMQIRGGESEPDVVAVDDALMAFAAFDPRGARVVEFGSLNRSYGRIGRLPT